MKYKIGQSVKCKDKNYDEYHGDIVFIAYNNTYQEFIYYCNMYPHEISDDKHQTIRCECININNMLDKEGNLLTLHFLNTFKESEIEKYNDID